MGQAHLDTRIRQRETNKMVSSAVDDFFAEQQFKRDNYVHQEFKIKRIPNGLYVVYLEGGGCIPNALSGHYTNTFAATNAINNWVKENLKK